MCTRTLETGGRNLVDGFRNLLDDWERVVRGKPPAGAEAFKVGRDVAITPGKVVYRNRLIELIQYAPTTETVQSRADPDRARLDHEILHPGPFAGELARPLPDRTRLHGLHDLLEEPRPQTIGISGWRIIARSASWRRSMPSPPIAPGRQVHAVGYCLGGTLLAIAAATMARDGDDRLKTVTLLAAQADFREAGELTLFINESQIHFLEDLMRSQGYLDAKQMAGAFQLLRSNDLIWSRMVRRYLMGEPSAHERSDGLERRRHPHALSHALGIPATPVPRQ